MTKALQFAKDNLDTSLDQLKEILPISGGVAQEGI